MSTEVRGREDKLGGSCLQRGLDRSELPIRAENNGLIVQHTKVTQHFLIPALLML